MRIYGLTGGIGSGKSEAGRRFAALGFPVIDADEIGHQVIEPGGFVADDVAAAFGADILTDGIIDRRKLGARVFSDPDALRTLNGIVHPAIHRASARRCAALAREGHDAAILDAALLAENGTKEPFLDGLIVVTCPRETRIARLAAARGWPREETERRMAAQTPPEQKLAAADWIIENNGTIAQLYARVDQIAGELRPYGNRAGQVP